MQALQLFYEMESLGVGLSFEGDRLGITHGDRIPLPLLEEVKKDKPNIIKILQQDQKAREAGFLPLQPGEVYERQYALNSHIFIILEPKEVTPNSPKWNVWRETFRDGQSISSKDIAMNCTTFDMALMKAEKYLSFFIRK